MHAAKDILDDVDSIGLDCGSVVAILVGHGGEYSLGRIELVGSVSQRLVLACESWRFCRTGILGCPLFTKPRQNDRRIIVTMPAHTNATGTLACPTRKPVLRLQPPSR